MKRICAAIIRVNQGQFWQRHLYIYFYRYRGDTGYCSSVSEPEFHQIAGLVESRGIVVIPKMTVARTNNIIKCYYFIYIEAVKVEDLHGRHLLSLLFTGWFMLEYDMMTENKTFFFQFFKSV